MERLFKTVQDRLVKELRLAGIATIEAANRFLEAWLSIYNRRFTVQPGPDRRSASAEASGRGSEPYPVYQDHTVPAP